jgi:hypothetical protein
MLDELNLVAMIEVTGALKVGTVSPPGNSFKLVVKNQGETIQKPEGKEGDPFAFSLAGVMNSSEKALFLDETEARACEATPPTEDWKITWDFPTDHPETFVVHIVTFNKTILEKDKDLTVEFTKVVSKTAPGKASLDLTAEFDTKTKPVKEVPVEKVSLRPGIIAFYSEPPEGVQNLPGQNVTLKWRTFEMANCKLEQVGVSDPLLADLQGDEGSYVVAGVSTDVRFKLSGLPPADRTLDVKVLKSGWHDTANCILKGDPAYPRPTNLAAAVAIGEKEKKEKAEKKEEREEAGFQLEPTELINANDQCLYAVFRHTFLGEERSFLFRTQNPFAKWHVVECSVPNQKDRGIPAGFVTSPGVYFDDCIWLIGGSQIDPETTSNNVWRLHLDQTTKKGVWENLGAAGWTPRMGHAVLVFENSIWVMGGRDSAGNALNDVWTWSPGTKRWDCVQRVAEWAPRCLFRPAAFDKQIWLFGGAKEPFSSELYSDVWVYSPSSKKWEEKKITGEILPREKPVGSCLGVIKGYLRLFGSFVSTSADGQRSERVKPLAFTLKNLDTRTWSDIPREGLMDWGGENTFSYQLVSFGDKILIAKALSYEQFNPVLKVYVPPS